MTPKIEKAAVLGAGTMGAQIAAHLANLNVKTVLLDLPSDGPDRSAVARKSAAALSKMKPPPFFVPEKARLIEIGNFDDDMEKISDCDWVVEAIAEKLEWKRDLWKRTLPHLHPNAVVSSNTSGLPLAQIAEGFPEDFRRRWLGTHFFNPPRYMKLLEIIPGPDTSPEVVERMREFGDRFLGKGVVVAKDRPNFIGNRIGCFVAARAMTLRKELGLTIEEVDALTGPVIGRPKTATFKLGDLVGNDVLAHVGENLYHALPEDPWREMFRPDDLLKEIVSRGWTGRKAGGGFYKKVGKEILALDPETMEYRSQLPPQIPSLTAVKGESDSVKRVRTLLGADDKASRFLWPYLRDMFAYSAERIPEISDQFYQVDQAMRWGFAWELGPFELWDGLGAAQVVEQARGEGVQFPDWIDQVLSQPRQSFYSDGAQPAYFDLGANQYQPLPLEEEKITLALLKERKPPVLSNESASLLDLGDGVACLEFHSKMNSLDDKIVALSQQALAEVDKNFAAMVVGNQGDNFSVGANLFFLLQASLQGHWELIEQAVRAFQNMTSSFRHSPKPVVAAPFSRTLAGGAEVCLGSDAVAAAAETYMGVVEVGVGLIPAGGGTKELLARNVEEFGDDPSADRMPGVKRAFQTIGMAKVSSSAEEAQRLRFLRNGDVIEINGDRLLYRAKKLALGLAQAGYRQPQPRQNIWVEGAAGLAVLKVGLHLMKQAGYISEYDQFIGAKLSYILTGGDLNHATTVSEQYLLDLEREAFLSLCGEEKTQQRIEAMLKTGKPLRN